MSNALSKKLAAPASSSPAAKPASTSPAATAPIEAVPVQAETREKCFEPDDTNGYAAEFVTADGKMTLLPYHHFSHALGSADGKTLTLIYWSHEVKITGTNLKKIKEVIATAKNFIVRAVDEKYSRLYTPTDVCVTKLEVKERKEEEEEKHGGRADRDADSEEDDGMPSNTPE